MNGNNTTTLTLINKKQIAAINATLYKLGMLRGERFSKGEKASLVRQYSGGRTDSSTGLFHNEAVQLINDLNRQTGFSPKEKPGEKQRRRIIAMAHDMRWQLPGYKVDMKRVNDWCCTYGYLHKKLNDYTEAELPKLVSQFMQVHQSFLKHI